MKKIDLHTASCFEVQRYSPKHQHAWNDFVSTAKNATFLFHRDFMEYLQDHFEDFSLMVFNDDKLLALMPANKHGNELHSHQGLSYGGLVLDGYIGFDNVLKIFREILKYLNQIGIQWLHLKLLPKIYHALPSDEIDYLLFLVKAEMTRRDLTQTIALSNKRTIRSSNRKRNLKTAYKNELTIVESAHFEAFWTNILIPNLQSTFGVKPVHSLNEITILKNRFKDQIRQFDVYHQSDIVAGVTIFETERVAHAQYISASPKGRETGALDLAFHYLINEVYATKAYFDFGISNENQGRAVNLGLQSWKESFGAFPIVHDFFRVNTENHHLLNDVLK
ncbi:MAG TPA: GNAT family N-acetyltransferase [Aquaticitalea sp.]|nr:GNAT family N-acetyltransferase [Aquaticitalea sp.]